MERIQRLEMKGISKYFHGFPANKVIDLSIESGEIVGLLGENGAGKTTLMNILYGLYRPDEGEISINGKPVMFRTPRDSKRCGIGMVHQHFMLVQNHTVAENVVLGCEDLPFLFPTRHVKKLLSGFASKYGLAVDPDEKLWHLSAGQQQRVEIVKTLLGGADLLILDEPTSVLTPQESEDLFAILRKMAAEGHSIILISHKLDEIMAICNRVTVLRKGQVVGSAETISSSKGELARMMVGREILFKLDRKELPPGETVLQVKDLTVSGDRGPTAVKNVSFQVRKNEIFGVAGVSGNGQRELVEAVTGLRKVEGGSVFIDGKDITNHSARVVAAHGISHVPEERIRFGIVPNLFIYENAILKHHHTRPFSDVLFLDYPVIRTHTDSLVQNYQVSTPSIDIPLKNLSGGNIQKLILGREIARNPSLLVASHPTYGLDVGATEYIRRQLLQRREGGGAIFLISEDLEEIFELCDRIAVIFGGEFMGIVSPREVSMEDIGLMMAGSKRMALPEEEAVRQNASAEGELR